MTEVPKEITNKIAELDERYSRLKELITDQEVALTRIAEAKARVVSRLREYRGERYGIRMRRAGLRYAVHALNGTLTTDPRGPIVVAEVIDLDLDDLDFGDFGGVEEVQVEEVVIRVEEPRVEPFKERINLGEGFNTENQPPGNNTEDVLQAPTPPPATATPRKRGRGRPKKAAPINENLSKTDRVYEVIRTKGPITAGGIADELGYQSGQAVGALIGKLSSDGRVHRDGNAWVT